MLIIKQIFRDAMSQLIRLGLYVIVIITMTKDGHGQQYPDSLSVDSLSADSAAYRQQAGAQLMVPMALPSPPNISYTIPSQLQAGVAVSFSPTNSGGSVYADWDVTTFAGSIQGYADGTGAVAKFYYPSGMVSDASGNLYISDSRNHRIRKVTPAGTVTTFAGSGVAGSADGTGTAAGFNYPVGLALDGSGNLYVVDRSNHRIRRITPSGVVSTLAGSTQGFANGTGTAARFNAPSDVAVDASGNVYVTDEQNQRIRKITSSGAVTTLAGSGTQGNADGTGTSAQFNIPQGLAIDGLGNLYVGDQVGNRIRKVTSSGVVTTLTTAISRPISLERDASGNLYAGELNTHMIKRITPAGVVTTVAGTGSAGSDNGAPLSASFNFLGGITFDPQGNRYVTDMYNNRIRRMGTGQGYSVSPALPPGLTLNKTTGVISGTPTAVTASQSYTVTAYNAGGSDPYSVTFSVGGGAFSLNQNYIVKTAYRKPFANPQSDPAVGDAVRDVIYYDEFGRPIQNISMKASSDSKDVIISTSYDNMGRQTHNYLPYKSTHGTAGSFRNDALSRQATYYASTPPGGQAVNAYPYARTVYETAVTGRLLEQGFAGATWQPQQTSIPGSGHTVRSFYTTNNIDDYTARGTTRRVARYTVSFDSQGIPVLAINGYYAAGQLNVSITRGENWSASGSAFEQRLHSTEDYTDKEGRVLLRRTFNKNGTTEEILSTYYVYDTFGNLTYVLPPGSEPDRTAFPSDKADWLNRFAYQYRYDGRNRMSHRRLPGTGGWENYIYNALDQLVFHQDSRQQGEPYQGLGPGPYHTFMKYDVRGRVIMKGVEKNRTMTYDAIVSALATWPVQWENRSSTSGNHHGYTNAGVPSSAADMDVLEVNYFDTYVGIPSLPHNQSSNYTKLTEGLLVASKVKVLGTASTYLWTVNYYDNKGQLVRQYRQHYQGGGVSSTKFDDITNEYNFTGQLVKSTRKHHTASATTPALTIVSEYTYDHLGRQRDTYKTVTLPSPAPTGIRTLIARKTYNDVGQVQTTSLHSTNSGGAFAVQNSMSYNARGWLTGNSTPQFAMELQYDNGTVPQYNGNIAGQKWGIPGNLDKVYTYHYDALNRLTEGTMANNSAREAVVYNKQGNITGLTRTIGTGSTVVDQLTYSYNGNRLTSVADANSHNATPNPYQLTGTTGYLYGANGNVSRRRNVSATINNIDTIIYNYLDLPQQINAPSGNVTLTYDGAGRKLRRQFAGINTDYIDGIQYEGTSASFIQTEVGRAVRSGDSYRYEYTLVDHLGNARYSFDYYNNAVRKQQSDDYYPFGLTFNSTVPGGQKNDYLYNGKELQNGIRQYDYGARLYDPIIGRWGVIDPLQEVYYPISPYTYAGNNPLMFVDVNGEYVGTVTGLLSGAIMGAVMAAIDGKNIYNGMLKGAAVGGIAGAAFDISVATLGTAPAAVVAAGAISGAVGSVADQLMETGRVSAGQVAVSAVAGGALGYAGSKLAPVAGRLVGAAEQAVEKTAARAVGSLANSAVRSIGSYADDVGRGGISLADEVANNAARAGSGLYDGVRTASRFLREQGMPRTYRKQILGSFEIETISLRTADDATFGLRFYGGAANRSGRYLFPTFTNYTNRVGLALPRKWNSMSGIQQFQITPGSPFIFGRAASQGGIYTAGSYQMYVPNINNLMQ